MNRTANRLPVVIGRPATGSSRRLHTSRAIRTAARHAGRRGRED